MVVRKGAHAPSLALAILVGALLLPRAAVAKDAFSTGIGQYNASDYSGALISFSEALDATSNRRRRARIYTYIGLIQVQFGSTDDAVSNFERALELDASVKLPSRAPRRVRKLVANLRKKHVRPTRKRKRKKRDRARFEALARSAAKNKSESNASPKSEQPYIPQEIHPDDPSIPNPSRAGGDASPDTPPAAPGGPGTSGTSAPDAGAVTANGTSGAAMAGVRGPQADPNAALTLQPAPPSEVASTVGWISVAAGAAALVAGGVFFGLARGTNADAFAAPVAADAARLHDDALGQQTIGVVGLGVGGALIVGGLIAIAVD